MYPRNEKKKNNYRTNKNVWDKPKSDVRKQEKKEVGLPVDKMIDVLHQAIDKVTGYLEAIDNPNIECKFAYNDKKMNTGTCIMNITVLNNETGKKRYVTCIITYAKYVDTFNISVINPIPADVKVLFASSDKSKFLLEKMDKYVPEIIKSSIRLTENNDKETETETEN